MTEIEAWKFVAETFRQGAIGDGMGAYFVRSRVPTACRNRVYGICHELTNLKSSWNIKDGVSYEVWDQMHDRVYQNRPEESGDDAYFWETTEENLKVRAAFCEKMAELCSTQELEAR